MARWTRIGVAGALALGAALGIGPLDASGAPDPSLRAPIPTSGADLAPVLSDDGTVVAFVNKPTSGTDQVIVHDRRAGTTTPIAGSEGATSVGISGDGCTVVWPSATVPPPTSSTSSTSSSTTSSSTSTTTTTTTTTVAGTAASLRAPAAQVQSWRVFVADRCSAPDPVVTEIATNLPFGPLGRPAVSLDGGTIVVSSGAEVLRFDGDGTTYAQSTVAPPAQLPTARYGPVVDLSDDGSVVVFSGGPDPSNPAGMTVYRSDAATGAAIEVSAAAHFPSVSGDGSIVAYALVAASSTVAVRAGTAKPVILDAGSRPQISGDGNHVVYETGPAVRITAWTGDGNEPFAETATLALTGPTAPTERGPTINRFGATVATDATVAGDIEITDLPADASFATGTIEVSPPDADAPLSAALKFTNDGPASVGVESIVASGALTIVSEDCSPVVRPESTCVVEVSFPDAAAAEAGGSVTLTPIGIFPVPFGVDVRGVAPPTTAPPTTTPPTTNPSNPSTPSNPSRPGTGTRPPVFVPTRPPSSNSSSSFPSSSFPSSSSSSSSSSFPSSSSSGLAFEPAVFAFTVDDVEPDSEQLTGIVEIVNTSSTVAGVAGVRLEPVEAVAFEIISTTCADAQLQPAGRCRVTVGYTLGTDGPQTVEVVAALDDGSEIAATINGFELVPELTVWPDKATTSQVVTLSGSGFLPDVSIELEWADAVREVQVDSAGTFAVPVVVPDAGRTGPMVATVLASDIRADDVSATMLVTAATTRRGPHVIESLGPDVGG